MDFIITGLSPELAEKFYELANNKFEGDIDEAVGEAIRLLLVFAKKRSGSDLF